MTTTTKAARWRSVRDYLVRADRARGSERDELLMAVAARTQVALLDSLAEMAKAAPKSYNS
jgi:hypothetical protein